MTAFAGLLALSTLGWFGEGADLLRFGGDLAEGVLVNRTVGAAPDAAIDPVRATVVFVHGINPAPRLVHFEMTRHLAEALSRRPGGPAFNVLEWDWNGATFAGVRPGANIEAAVAQGPLLADALFRAGVDPSRLHLIGHSAGSIVAASAARSIAASRGVLVAHLTVLEPAAYYHPVIFERLAAGSTAVRVDNVWADGPSGFGRHAPYAGVANASVRGRTPWLGVVAPMRSGHMDVVRWYAGTASRPGCPHGFNASALLGR